MPLHPPLTIEGEQFAQSITRSARDFPNRIFINDLSEKHSITWEQSHNLIHAVIREWQSTGVRDQILLMCDASWRTTIAVLAAHLSGRVALLADASNPATYSGEPLSRAQIDVISPEEIVALNRAGDPPIETYPALHQWPEGSLARVFLTSGSTGTPKLLGAIAESQFGGWSPLFERGVRASHYSVLNVRRPSTIVYFANLRRAVRSSGTLFLFDILKHDFRQLDDLLKDTTFSEMSLTPTMAMQLTSSTSGLWKKHVENINLAGEKVTRECLQAVRQSFPDSLIRNAYGMTEISATIAELQIEPDDTLPNDPVPVGKPLHGLTVHIVSEEGEELPPGELGQIIVSGLPSSMEGHVDENGRIEFHTLHPPDHLETGDLGFLTPDEMLVVEGRWEQMVKIRGERVSLLEVEKAILETGLVAQALAATYTGIHGSTAVGALLVSHETDIPSTAELRRAITKNNRLIFSPTRIRQVDEIPKLTVGKVDRVTASELLQSDTSTKLAEVYNAAEMTLSGLIGNILGIDFVARDEDIFSLGADSLSCLEIIHDIENVFTREVDIAFLLQYPTISLIAEALSRDFSQGSRLVQLVPSMCETTIYWVLPGSNPYMARPIALEFSDVRHVALLNLGSLPGDVVLGDFDQMVEALQWAIVNENPRNSFFVAGFSSASYLANALCQSLVDGGLSPKGLIVIDPPTHETIVEEWCRSGKTAHPIHMMTAREGYLSRLAPGTADHALFGLQAFALSRHTPQHLDLPRLFISSSADRLLEQHWSPLKSDQVVIADVQHLNFIREPSVVVNCLRGWPEINNYLAES